MNNKKKFPVVEAFPVSDSYHCLHKMFLIEEWKSNVSDEPNFILMFLQE